jgi:hypothetical protein
MFPTSTSVLTLARDVNRSSASADSAVASRCRLVRFVSCASAAGGAPAGDTWSPVIASVRSAERADSSAGRLCGMPGAVSVLRACVSYVVCRKSLAGSLHG